MNSKMIDISKYSIRQQYWLIMKNNEFKKVFNMAANFSIVVTKLESICIYSPEVLELLKSKFYSQ